MVTSNTPAGTVRRPPRNGAAYAAATWSFIFAALSFYWALGGSFLVRTQSPQILELAAQPWFVVVLWLTGLFKAAAGMVALSLVERWGKRFPLWFRSLVNWSIGLSLTLYGGANLAVRGLMTLEVLETPVSMRSPAAWWHLILWDPWFLLGGALFLGAAWHFSRSLKRPQQVIR